MYIGIDNGLDGGIAALTDSGQIVLLAPLPVVKTGKTRRLDVTELAATIDRLQAKSELPIRVVVERPTKHSPGKMALCSTWFTYGQIEGMIEVKRYPSIVMDSPLKWQKEFWARPKMAAGQKFDTKAAALSVAKRLFPEQGFLASARCTKPHDGMVDAVLIAEYARRKHL